MQRLFKKRRLLIFMSAFLVSAAILLSIVITRGIDMGRSDRLVAETHATIQEAQELVTKINAMVASQRGFLLSGQSDFLDSYEDQRIGVSGHLSKLSELVSNDPSQVSHLAELQHYYLRFADLLEQAIQLRQAYGDNPEISSNLIFADTKTMSDLREQIARTVQLILQEEYAILDNRVGQMELKEKRYQVIFILGGAVSLLLLILLNSALFFEQSKRQRSERSLAESEDRLHLALQGMNDGIYDWNIAEDRFYLSPRFKEMLGYNDAEIENKVESLDLLIHPDDREQVWFSVNQYLEGALSEFSIIFRMIHKSGRIIWINSRGKAVFNHGGKAVRIVGAHSDITHMKDYEERLKASKEEAERANAAKSDFLAHMSHEIRTPLMAISGAGELLQLGKKNLTEKQKNLVKILNSGVSTLQDLINDVLDTAKIESGELRLTEEDFELGELFEQISDLMAVRADEKDIDTVYDFAEVKDEIFFGDRLRIRQILINLIGNAIKFTEKGSITVTATAEENDDGRCLCVEVKDTGIGISEKNLDLIFDRFKQGDEYINRRFGGSGLGLTISRNLAHLMNGDISVASKLGEGSSFTLKIPFSTEISGLERSGKHSESPRIEVSDNCRVLIVEDYEPNITIFSHFIESANVKYDVARNGNEAIQKWQDGSYNLIFMDVQMPEKNGLDATNEIRELEEKEGRERVIIVGMTAHALAGDRARCLAIGMDDYYAKPITGKTFTTILNKYLATCAPKKAASG